MTRSSHKPNLTDLTDVPASYGSSVTSTLCTTHLDRHLIEDVPLSAWEELFCAFGRPAGLPAKLSHDEISKLLLSTTAIVPAPLAQALDGLADLAHDDGREAIFAATEARAFDARKWKDDESPPELAARVLCESQRDQKLRECLLHARVLVWDKAGTKRFHQFVGREPQRVRKPANKLNAIKQAVSDWCSNNGRGAYADVLVLDDGEDNELRLEIFHAHRQQAPLIVEGNRRLRRPQRLAHCDSLRYDPTFGRLRIAARTASMIDWYRALFGRIFFADPEFFAQGRICDLSELQRGGQRALDAHNLGHVITRARVKELLWQADDRDSIWIRSSDCFEAAARKRLDFRTGTLLEAKIDLWFAEGGRRSTVNVKVPSRIDYRQDARSELIETYVSQVGIRRAGRSEEDQDLWTLAPWRHTQSDWRAAIGEHTDKFVQLEIMRRVPLEKVPSPALNAAGRKLRVERADQDGTSVLVGVPDDDDLPTRALTTSDIDGLELDPAAYARYVQSIVGTGGSVAEISGSGTFAIGTRTIGNSGIAFYLVARPPSGSNSLIATLTTANTGRPVLLVPRGKTTELGLPELELSFPLPAVIDVVGQAIEALGLADKASAIDLARSNERLVFDPRTESVWLLHKLLELDGQPKTLLHELLKQHPRAVPTDEMERLLGSARKDKGATKQAKSRLLADIKAQVPAFTDELVENKRNLGLRLTIAPWAPSRR